MIDDATLLDRYARDRSEEAFGEVVQRHVGLVYSAAFRRTGGDAHLAKDVTQIVFIALARDAAALSRHAALTGWLYAATRNAAIDFMRAEHSRRQREEKVRIMDEILSSNETPVDWEQLRPVLDEAMDELDEREREAVLLRFFERRPFASIAVALRVSEEAARKRVDRALDKLGSLLARRGITSTGGALAVLLANQTAVAVPAGVTASIAAVAVAGASAGAAIGVGAAATAGIFIMSTSKMVVGAAALIALAAIGTTLYQAKNSREAEAATVAVRMERDQLRTRLSALEKSAPPANSTPPVAQKSSPPATEAAAVQAAASQYSTLDYVYTHPEAHSAFVEQQVLRSKARFDRFFKMSGLPVEKQEKLLNVYREQQASQLDLMAALYQQGYTLDNMPNDQRAVLKMVADTVQRRDKEEGAILGDTGYKAFHQFLAEVPARNVASAVAGHLYDTSEPLTAAQADRLVEILKQNPLNVDAETGNRMNGTVITKQARQARLQQETRSGGLAALDRLEPVTDAAMARAQTVLTPTQLSALKQVQAQQATEFQVAPRTTSFVQPAAGGK